MPTRAEVQTMRDVFGQPMKYRIPEFQRLYSWKRDDQWAPLWQDVTAIAKQLLAGAPSLPHFMGAVVLQPTCTAQGVRVIDGQQRLTTVQIVIAALRTIFGRSGYDDLKSELDVFTRNDDGSGKILHDNNNDRMAFAAILSDNELPQPANPIALAYAYFRRAASRWIDAAGPDNRRGRCGALKTAMLDHLQFVRILLDESEKPHDIFEVLNGRARALRQSDLVRNLVMYEAQEAHELEFVREVWSYFDESPWWNREQDEGNNRFDWFLNIWVAMKKHGWPERRRVAASFRLHVERNEVPISHVVEELRQAGIKYREIEEDSFPELGRLKTLAPGRLAIPWFLLIYTQVVDVGIRNRALQALESYLARQFLVSDVVAWPPGVAFFTKLLTYDTNGGYDDAIIDALDQQQAAPWWTDNWFSAVFSNSCTVRGTKRLRRMLMIEIEKTMRNMGRDEVLDDDLDLLEVIPRIPPLASPLTAELQSAALRLGNLTLVPRNAVNALAGTPWNQQREVLSNHQDILLNGDILDHVQREEDWDVAVIKARTRRLTERILQIWPSAVTIGDPG